MRRLDSMCSVLEAGSLGGRVPDAVRLTALLGPWPAPAAVELGGVAPALGADTPGDTLGGLPIVALRVALAPGLDVLVGHRGVLPAGVRIRAGYAFP